MLREFSAGGVVVRKLRGDWMLAAIRPGGRKPGTWALPKGAVDAGEDPAATAVREVREETGVQARLDQRQRAFLHVLRREVKRRDALAVGRHQTGQPPALELKSRDAQILSPVDGL